EEPRSARPLSAAGPARRFGPDRAEEAGRARQRPAAGDRRPARGPSPRAEAVSVFGAAHLGQWRWLAGSLRAARGKLVWAALAVLADGLLTLCRPWPVKVVIDRVLMSSHRPLRVPFIAPWLDGLSPARGQFLLGACATSLVVGLGTGLFTYAYTRGMGDVGR